MKFENSLFEERYNDYWNTHVVTSDHKIRNISLGITFFDENANVGKLITTYQRHVLNILTNLDRQAYMFEDTEYLQNYRENTISQAVEDLSFYASVFPEYKNVAKDCINALGVKTSLEANETYLL
jgi:hypothetical protein